VRITACFPVINAKWLNEKYKRHNLFMSFWSVLRKVYITVASVFYVVKANAFWMCSSDVRFTVQCVFNVIFKFSTLKMTSKTHMTRKRTSKLHIQNAGVIDPLAVKNTDLQITDTMQILPKFGRLKWKAGNDSCVSFMYVCMIHWSFFVLLY
jgi:predicted membrane protein